MHDMGEAARVSAQAEARLKSRLAYLRGVERANDRGELVHEETLDGARRLFVEAYDEAAALSEPDFFVSGLVTSLRDEYLRVVSEL